MLLLERLTTTIRSRATRNQRTMKRSQEFVAANTRLLDRWSVLDGGLSTLVRTELVVVGKRLRAVDSGPTALMGSCDSGPLLDGLCTQCVPGFPIEPSVSARISERSAPASWAFGCCDT